LGPLDGHGAQVSAQRGPGRRDGLAVRMQVALSGDQRTMPSDLPEHVDRDARVSHPGQPRVAEVVVAKMLIPKAGDHLVPIGRIAQDRRADPPAPRWLTLAD
jgi:hypothetical protein